MICDTISRFDSINSLERFPIQFQFSEQWSEENFNMRNRERTSNMLCNI